MEPLLIGVSRSSPYMVPRESVAKSLPLSMCARHILSLRVIPWEKFVTETFPSGYMGSGGVDNLLSRAFTRIAKASRGPRFYSPVHLCVWGVLCPWPLLLSTGHAGHGVYLPRRAENPHGDLAGKCKRTGERVKRKGVPLSAATLHLENLSAATLPILKSGARIQESQA